MLDGGSGTDTLFYTYAASAVSVSLAIGGAQATGGAGTDTLTSIENLYGSAFNDTLTGDINANTIDGSAGADTMIGGGGSDIYYVDNVGDTVTETSPDRATGGIDSVYTTLPAYTLPSNVEKLRILASGPANGTGNNLDNSLYAGPGNNVLEGGGGTDTLSYLYATGAVSVSLNVLDPQFTGASGADTLINIENLYGGAFDDTLTGDANANRLDGGAGADTLSGGAGADTLVGAAGADAMSGGDGSDSYYVDDPGDLVAETNTVLASGGNDTVYSYLAAYTLTNYVENLQILATGAANGTGNSLNNSLYAGAGDNLLDGGSGTDTLFYTYAASAVSVSLAIGGAQATGGSGTDTLTSIENLYGSAFNDTLTGDINANTIDGSAGADTMIGGGGSDIYYVDNVGDTVTEASPDLATGGIDSVYTTLPAYTLPSNVEKLRILASDPANGTGNGLDNSLYAGAGANVLDGGDGTDTLSYLYATGAVSVSLNVLDPQLTGASGTDTLISIENLYGGPFDDTLTGDANANRLDGGAGADTLLGGAGADTLVGGSGYDHFAFETNFGSDRITDFTPREDLIQLSVALGYTDFSELDTNADGTLSTGDTTIQLVGMDLLIAFGTNQITIVGQSHLSTSDLLLV